MKTEVRNLTRVFGKTVAVNDISFSFEDGKDFDFPVSSSKHFLASFNLTVIT